MRDRFHPQEVLMIAQEIERNGRDFYRDAAKVVDDEQMRSLLDELADWEGKHLTTFTRLLESAKESEEVPWDVDGQAENYLQAVIDGRIFGPRSQREERARALESTEGILRFALAREKDTVVYYSSLDIVLADRAGQEAVRQILPEELSHVQMIEEHLRRLGAS